MVYADLGAGSDKSKWKSYSNVFQSEGAGVRNTTTGAYYDASVTEVRKGTTNKGTTIYYKGSTAKAGQALPSYDTPNTNPNVVSVSPALYNKFLLDTRGAFPTEQRMLANGRIMTSPVPFARTGDRPYLISQTEGEVKEYKFNLVTGGDVLGRSLRGEPTFIETIKPRPKEERYGFTTSNILKESFGVAKGFSNIPVSAVKGAGKAVMFNFNPNYWLPSKERDAELIRLQNDKDVKTAVTGVVLIGGSLASPVVAGLVTVGGLGAGAYYGYQGIKSRSSETFGEGLFLFTTSKPLKVLERPVFNLLGDKVNPDTVTGLKVTSSSSSEALAQFEAGRTSEGIDVIHVSQGPLKGAVMGGEKGRAGIEDAGLFVGPKGRANLMFAGLLGSKSSSSKPSISFKLFDFFRPSVTSIRVQSIEYLPKNILAERGFGGPERTAFNEKMVGQGVVFITKRSMIGKGELPRQYFTPTRDFFGDKLVRKAGVYYLERGTIESEGTIPENSVLARIDVTTGEKFRYTIVGQKTILGRKIPLTGDLLRLPRTELVMNGRSSRGFSNDFIDAKTLLGKEASNNLSYIEGGRDVSISNVFRGGGGSGGRSRARFQVSPELVSSSSPSQALYPISIGSFNSRSSISGSSGTPSVPSFSGGISSRGIGNPFGSSPSSPSNAYSPLVPSITTGRSNSSGSISFSLANFNKSSSRKGSDFRISRPLSVAFKPKYFASIEATAFNIKGKPSKTATRTGFEIRPITRRRA